MIAETGQANLDALALRQILNSVEDSIVGLHDTSEQVEDPLIATTLSRLANRRCRYLTILAREMRQRSRSSQVVAIAPELGLPSVLCRKAHIGRLVHRINEEERLLNQVKGKLQDRHLSDGGLDVVEEVVAHVRRSLAHLQEVADYLDTSGEIDNAVPDQGASLADSNHDT